MSVSSHFVGLCVPSLWMLVLPFDDRKKIFDLSNKADINPKRQEKLP